MGRLAIDKPCQNKGLGKALLLDVADRTIQAGEIAGVTALLVHALSEEAKRFYTLILWKFKNAGDGRPAYFILPSTNST